MYTIKEIMSDFRIQRNVLKLSYYVSYFLLFVVAEIDDKTEILYDKNGQSVGRAREGNRWNIFYMDKDWANQ